MTIFWHIIHLAQIMLCLYGCIKYWQLRRQGFLEDWYPRIGWFIASYGGFIGGLAWYIMNHRYL